MVDLTAIVCSMSLGFVCLGVFIICFWLDVCLAGWFIGFFTSLGDLFFFF